MHVVDSGLQCNQTNFTSCTSINGGGGEIYYLNSLELVNNLTFKELWFNECKAVYGGAVYIYSFSENNNFTIDSCIFLYNEAYPKKKVLKMIMVSLEEARSS